MTIFEASNGIKVDSETQGITGRRRIQFDHGNHGTTVEMSAEEAAALIENLDHERDEELGRWRWPTNREYVVYPPDESGFVLAVNEVKGFSGRWNRENSAHAHLVMDGAAARAYFEAHPERKPWHEAEPGDLWVITLDDNELGVSVETFDPGENVFQVPDAESVSLSNPRITAGRKLWPEDAS